MGSAWRWTTFHSASSSRRAIVTRRSQGVTFSAPPTLALVRSIHKMQASSAVAYSATVSKAQISPSLNVVAPRSWASRTSSHPRGRAEGVSQGYVFSVGEELLHGLWVAFDQLLSGLLEPFEYPVEFFRSGHLGLTSTFDPSPF
jgi:hypothetical protein